jgi:hypothetical protein
MPFTINDDATPPVFCRCALLNTNSSMASLVFVFSLLPFVKEYVLWCDELDEELSCDRDTTKRKWNLVRAMFCCQGDELTRKTIAWECQLQMVAADSTRR